MDAKKESTLRIVKTGSQLPADRESVYWINVKAIPAVDSGAAKSQNILQIAIKTRVKLYYRPAGLEGSANDAYKQLTLQRAGNGINIKNPTPYYITLGSLKVNGRELHGMMVPPFNNK
ncbi:molecular chaperone [Citrobacter freundii]|nr:molecular chaperone [Citrobacter freundii]